MSGYLAVRISMLGLGMLLASVAPAQIKVGVVNLQRAVLESAEIKKASAAMEARYKPRQLEAQKVEKELQDIQNQLQTGAGKLSSEAETELQARGQRRQRELQRLSEDLQNDVDRERNEVLGRSSKQMQAVVAKLAEAKGLDLVVDSSSTLYFKTALEITSEAIAAYDKEYPPK
jgi:outer membrane protein